MDLKREASSDATEHPAKRSKNDTDDTDSNSGINVWDVPASDDFFYNESPERTDGPGVVFIKEEFNELELTIEPDDLEFEPELHEQNCVIDDEECGQIFISKDDTPIVWRRSPCPQPFIPFNKLRGMLKLIAHPSPADYFLLLASNSFFRVFISQINTMGERIYVNWNAIDRVTAERFLAILFWLGHVKLPHFRMIWANDSLYQFPSVNGLMTKHRFTAILSTLQVPEVKPQKKVDVLLKTRTLMNHLHLSFKQSYSPSKHLVIEECLLPNNGIVNIRRVNEEAMDQYSLKMYNLCEKNGTVLNSVVWMGQEDRLTPGCPETVELVRYLLHDYKGAGYLVHMDEKLHSPRLALCLLKDRILTVGPISKECGDLSEEILNPSKNSERLAFYTKDGLCLLKNDDTLMLSTAYNEETVLGEDGKRIPTMVQQYEEFMSSVESADLQASTFYSSESSFRRWNIKLLLRILQNTLHNAYFLYKTFGNGNLTLPDFRNEVIRCLRGSPVGPASVVSHRSIHLPSLNEKKAQEGTRTHRKKCVVCKKKNARRDVIYRCEDCPGRPGLCLNPCFRQYHNYEGEGASCS